ncbi:MAG TPA: ornithine cyclodeaminase family protein [Spirochaetales bacterium]|nr:ornithine cyclodeaminase family protein [Spirochaetales bacterium]HRY53958.1 ornithine cyclodeaminase family protein [Spirochaetia bacterium]HRZ64132.1 ornithine cyclodeaminase family protein [Spirochaetia bacterium]
MLVLSAADIARVFTVRDAIEADKKAFVMQARGECVVPLRINFDVEGSGGGQSLYMPAHVKGYPAPGGATGVKIVSVYPGNAAKGLPVVPATMVLVDEETGLVEALLDGTELTRLRTGALSGAATEVLAREDARVGALFGTGGQAASQLAAILEARPLAEVRVHDLDPGRREAFIRARRAECEARGCRLVAAASADAAIEGADVIVTVTTSAKPVFDGSRVAAGAHVNGIGSYTPDKAELDPALLVRADRVFVDNLAAVLAEAGDLVMPIKAGSFGPERVAGELGSVLDGSLPGRSSGKEITVFKSVGFAALDVVAAREIVTRAREAGVGRKIDS